MPEPTQEPSNNRELDDETWVYYCAYCGNAVGRDPWEAWFCGFTHRCAEEKVKAIRKEHVAEVVKESGI